MTAKKTKKSTKNTTKPASRKKAPATKRARKSKVEMVSYSIRMTIPTGQYANIQPEIIVKGGSLEEAHTYVAPHMNKLWKDYFMISERKTEVVVKPAPVKPAPVKPEPVKPEPVVEESSSPISETALVRATQAIQSCKSPEALDLIIKQVGASTKLEEEQKKSLLPLLDEKSAELHTKNK